MPISRDVRAALSMPVSRPPDADPSVAREFWQAWLDAKEAERTGRERTTDAPFWASDGAGCARRLGYNLLTRAGLGEPSNPPTLSSLWRFSLGDVVHSDHIQSLAEQLGYRNEVPAVIHDPATGRALVSCKADMVGHRRLVEVKSINGYGYKMAATSFRGAPEGPRFSAVAQLANTAAALAEAGEELDEGVILYVAMEVVSEKMIDTVEGDDAFLTELARFSVQWTYPIDELLALSQELTDRMVKVQTRVEDGAMPPRSFYDPDMPATAVVDDPSTGHWIVRDAKGHVTRTGKTWMCNYCDFQDLCASEADDAH